MLTVSLEHLLGMPTGRCDRAWYNVEGIPGSPRLWQSNRAQGVSGKGGGGKDWLALFEELIFRVAHE
jgi:hypothetical protein